ncbi:MAG: DUF4230 domain-containing protein [Prevotella sp.]|nr:DUF4230 domain-containing protein [Prevotella sp.]
MNGLVIGGIIIALLVGGYLLLKNADISLADDKKIELSPTIIEQIEAIGQWEFLAVSDEEIVDTVRHGVFSNDELVRIYKGTLRLGIDMADAAEGWIRADGDTIRVTLPPVKLLDENFLDETATRAFFETGKWTSQDRKKLAEKARRKMKNRCLTAANLSAAEQTGVSQFQQLLTSFGFEYVQVEIADSVKQK